MTVTRRGLLTAGLGVATLAGTPSLPAAATDPAFAGARRRAMRFLDLALDAHAGAGELRLPQSYADELGLYATAFTYDAALAALAYLDDDRPGSLDRAARIGEALHYAQQHDPVYDDGRLRQAYNAGPYTRNGVEQPDGFVRGDGTVNVGGAFGFLGSGAGEHAWAGLAWCALHQRTGDNRFLASAVAAGRWLTATCRSAGPLGGFTAGVDRDGNRLTRVSTVHNADLAAFFARLALVSGDRQWLDYRDTAATLVRRMWNAPRQAFAHSSRDGRTVERGPLVLEAQTHPWMALSDPDHTGCLDTARRRLTVTDTPAAPNSSVPGGIVTGLTVSSASTAADPGTPIEPGLPAPDPQAVWLEGTAQYAAALAHSPAGALRVATVQRALAGAQNRLSTVAHLAGEPVPAGVGLAAASSPLHVGYLDSGYYPVKHVAATAWLALALARTNPLSAGPVRA